MLKDQSIDIVICDFNLGTGQDGQQLLEEMRSTGEVTHVTQWVIITAETSKDMVMGAIENEPDDYLAKLSRQLKDYNASARAYKEVLSLSNNTLHDTPENYVNLADTLNTAARQGGDGKIRNATRQAMELAQRMTQRFPDKVSVSLKSRIIQINANDIQGLDKVRDKQLDKLFEQSMNNIDSLEQDFTLDIARTLYSFDRQQQGDEWVDALRRKYIDDSKFQQQLMMLQSEPISDIAKARAAELNKAGNTCYRNEDFPGALEKFSLALEYSPRHPGLILNIAQAYPKLYLDKPDPKHLSNMEGYLKRLIHLPQDHYQYERFQTLVQRLIALQEEAN